MADMEIKGFAAPEEKRPFVDKGEAHIVSLGGNTVMKATFMPGWHWTEHLGPIAGTDTCQSPHLLYCVSGRMRIRMDDGAEAECGPDDVVRIDPGHDAWVVGDAPCVVVDFGIAPSYAAHED